MERLFDLLDVRLNLFDGDGGAGDGSGTPAAQGNNGGESAGGAPAGKNAQTDGADGKQADEERREAYFKLINGEYKDLYDQEFQKSLDKRMRAKERETAGLQARLDASQPVLDTLFARYGITDGDVAKLGLALEQDNDYWARAAEQAGMSVEQYRQVQRMQVENERLRKMQARSQQQVQMQRQLAQWNTEAEALRETYPEFDLAAEAQNDVFLSLLKNGFSVKNAYESVHVEELLRREAQTAAAKTEKQVTDQIRARGMRPAENGTKPSAGFTTATDMDKMTKEQRADIFRRLTAGENVILGQEW